MKDVEFNLLDEPWVRVLSSDCRVQEISLTDTLLHAQEYTDLAGELPTQDVAMLRLLLAVLHTIFSQVDITGQEAPITSKESAVYRWNSLWQYGHFPEQPIRDYLSHWHDRFWLFHPERPFWQVPEAKIGTEYTAAKLNGELLESGNKIRLFSSCFDTGKNELSYAQAARWLLYINGYDDTSSKPKTKGLPSTGAGWLGKLGLIQAIGTNLFETLMLNLILIQDGEKLWGKNCPCWELDSPRKEERTAIPQPDNQAELLTLQSRRLLLRREHEVVTGYTLLGGDFFDRQNAFCEQMTTWRQNKELKNGPVIYTPKRHDPTKQFWREFPAVFSQAPNTRPPGIVRWITLLQNPKYRCLNRKQIIHFRICAMEYGDKDFFVTDMFRDELSFHIALMDDLGIRCRSSVITEIKRCERLANAVGDLAIALSTAAGNKPKTLPQDTKEQFYFQIDQPFRQWLYSIDPDWEEEEELASLNAWQKQAQQIALDLGRRLVEQAGPAAFMGRWVSKSKVKGKKEETEKVFYAAPKSYNKFLFQIRSIYDSEGGA